MNSLNKQKIAIFGSTGFIGKNIVHNLSKSYNISVFLRHQLEEIDKPLFDEVDVTISDMSLHSLVQFFQKQKPDYVINLISFVSADKAKEDFVKMFDSNFQSVDLLFKALLLSKTSIKHFIQFGSSEEYGNQIAPFIEDMLPISNSMYGLSKLMATNLVQLYSKEYSISSTILRPSNVFGKYQSKEKLIPYLVSAIKKGESLKISNTAKIREFYSVLDLIYSLKIVLSSSLSSFGEIVNLGYGSGISILQVINLIEKEVGKKAVLTIEPKLERINEPKVHVNSVDKFFHVFKKSPFESTFEKRLIQFINIQ